MTSAIELYTNQKPIWFLEVFLSLSKNTHKLWQYSFNNVFLSSKFLSSTTRFPYVYDSSSACSSQVTSWLLVWHKLPFDPILHQNSYPIPIATPQYSFYVSISIINFHHLIPRQVLISLVATSLLKTVSKMNELYCARRLVLGRFLQFSNICDCHSKPI